MKLETNLKVEDCTWVGVGSKRSSLKPTIFCVSSSISQIRLPARHGPNPQFTEFGAQFGHLSKKQHASFDRCAKCRGQRDANSRIRPETHNSFRFANPAEALTAQWRAFSRFIPSFTVFSGSLLFYALRASPAANLRMSFMVVVLCCRWSLLSSSSSLPLLVAAVCCCVKLIR